MVKVEEALYKGMLYIGYRPVFNGKKLSIEVNIFNFSESIYNHHITVMLKDRIRDDKQFRSTKELMKKMEEDKRAATKILS